MSLAALADGAASGELDGQPGPAATRRLQRFLVATMAVGGLIVVAALAAAARRPPPPWIAVAAVTLAFAAGDAATINLRFGHDRWKLTWSEAVLVVALVVLPFPWGGLAAGTGVAAAHLARRRPLAKVGFNAAATVIGAAAGRLAAFAITGRQPAQHEPIPWLGVVIAVIGFTLVSTTLVSAAVARSQDLPFWHVHRRALPLDGMVCAGNTALGCLLVIVAHHQPLGLLAFPVLLGVLAQAYVGYLRALDERDTWEHLQEVSRELLVADADQLAKVALQGAVGLLHAEFADLVLVEEEGARSMVGWRLTSPGAPLDRLDGDPFSVCAGHWGRVLTDRAPFAVERRRTTGPQHDELDALGLTTVHVAPLLVHGRCLGALRLGFRGPVRLRERERRILATFANHLSGAAGTVRLFDRLRSMALYDPLTGLPNRTELTTRLRDVLTSGTAVAVLFFDLDRFKVVNDSLGHHAGDAVLQEAAARLRAELPPGAIAGRFGGDELVVIAPGFDDASGGQLAERLAAAIGQPTRIDGRELVVTASVGVVTSVSGASASGLLRDADAAMYLAKERGRARCEVFTADVRTTAVRRLEVEQELRAGIERGELALHVQPIVELQSGQLSGVEALVRWRHPTRGLVSPMEFVPLAEETGLIHPLGSWVLRSALRDLRSWSSMAGQELDVSVNLSAHQLADPALVEGVLLALAEAGTPAERLILEVTETAVVDLGGAAVANLTALRSAGARVALDDFGTGWSSLSYLRSLPVDSVKLDRAFVARLDLDQRDRAVVGSMVGLAHALGLRVVAEGVERKAQVEVLVELGCDAAQGFLLQRPGPPEEVLGRLRAVPRSAAGL